MKKNFYEKPTMNIVKLQQKSHLLAGSDPMYNDPFNNNERNW